MTTLRQPHIDGPQDNMEANLVEERSGTPGSDAIGRADLSPCRGRLRPCRITRREKDLQLMRG